jgi:hypothetical protein
MHGLDKWFGIGFGPIVALVLSVDGFKAWHWNKSTLALPSTRQR